MSLPSHLILDLNVNHKKHNLPYWALNFTNTNNNPIFLDELNVSKFGTNNKPINYSWVNFLKSHTIPTNLDKHVKLLGDYNKSSQYATSSNSFSPENLININFLRYERLYTKLKYSRSPAFDIVSGGAAALLAGFVGFLISEKFGFELVDSGDFYYLFMYGVFATFILKPLLYISNVNNSILTSLSIKNPLKFFSQMFLLLLTSLKNNLKI